jgi:phosphoribosyl-AMP cyclohydrolase
MSVSWLDDIRWTEDGLCPVIAQQADTGKVLMFAWMNRESLTLTVAQKVMQFTGQDRVENYGAKVKSPGTGRK